jgi:hypothetical protein
LLIDWWSKLLQLLTHPKLEQWAGGGAIRICQALVWAWHCDRYPRDI